MSVSNIQHIPQAGVKSYVVTAYHVAERLRLKDIKDKLSYEAEEFSNYEMVVPLSSTKDSYVFFYSFGSIVFVNASAETIDRELAKLKVFLTQNDLTRTNDAFLIECDENFSNKVYFDRIQIKQFSYKTIKIVSLLLAQSTALESYDILIENLLEQTGRFSRKIEQEGRYLESSQGLIKFIGQCLNTKQEIISRLYIVDSPDELWEDNELERLFNDLKGMLEIDGRYRALEYKIKIIQESIEIIVDLSKSRQSTQLEMTIIILISVEIIMSIFFQFFMKK